MWTGELDPIALRQVMSRSEVELSISGRFAEPVSPQSCGNRVRDGIVSGRDRMAVPVFAIRVDAGSQHALKCWEGVDHVNPRREEEAECMGSGRRLGAPHLPEDHFLLQ